jgi:RimJ/RimL family protein N-acetyltransferase
MLALDINQGDFRFKNIEKDELNSVLKLYNESFESMFATGIDRDLSYKDIQEKYLEVLINSYEFFAGIYLKNEANIIGVVKGRIDYEDSEKFWISSFLIGKKHRNEGVGRRCINALISYMSETYDVKTASIGVLSNNSYGINFWKSMGFYHDRTIKEFISFNNAFEDFIIMKRDI